MVKKMRSVPPLSGRPAEDFVRNAQATESSERLDFTDNVASCRRILQKSVFPTNEEIIKNCPESTPDTREAWMRGVVWLMERTLGPVGRVIPEREYEYEIWMSSEPDDFVKMDGWFPISTDRIKNHARIEEYIRSGLLRKIK